MSNELARRLAVDISADNTTWARLVGTTDVNDQDNMTEQDASEYETDGFAATEVTMHGWLLAVKFNRKSNAGVFDPVQEIIRAARFKFGDAARVWVRWYDRNGRNDGKQGRALVEWNRSKTGVADIEEISVNFKGDGILVDIANPGNSTLPSVLSATPSGAAAGAQVTIGGQYFTGATGVKFGAVSATVFTVVSDTHIVATVPAGSAGSAPVTVTTAAGTSNALAYTRGA
ncbi:phage tail tube protein [Intrasporangium flavum]|uniref:phage tail tube protein n=1 Tax=Intrasporangium flavum TaxID=1428657 RepID=UPI00096EB6B7|nr:IPT/TIG domain-containing protein [Intrasporangium flavum]